MMPRSRLRCVGSGRRWCSNGSGRKTGCRAVIAELAGKRKHGFALERAVFLTVLHRLFVSGSDRAADRWREDYAIAGVEGLDLHHLYRAMAWLGEEPPEKGAGRPHTVRTALPEGRGWRSDGWAHRRDLLTRLDLVFMDFTSLYFEGAGRQTLGRHGYSKDHRPDRRRIILAVLIDGDGRPVCSEMWPGYSRRPTLIPVIDRLRRRFDIARVCIVADRGMISAETVAELEARGSCTYLACASVRTAGARVGARRSVPLVPLVMRKRGKEFDYQPRPCAGGRRYIVCRNHPEAEGCCRPRGDRGRAGAAACQGRQGVGQHPPK